MSDPIYGNTREVVRLTIENDKLRADLAQLRKAADEMANELEGVVAVNAAEAFGVRFESPALAAYRKTSGAVVDASMDAPSDERTSRPADGSDEPGTLEIRMHGGVAYAEGYREGLERAAAKASRLAVILAGNGTEDFADVVDVLAESIRALKGDDDAE